MKLYKLLIVCLIYLLTVSYKYDKSITTPVKLEISKNNSLYVQQNQTIVSALFCANGHAGEISQFYQYGWKGIGLYSDLDQGTECKANWKEAKNKYSPIYALIWRGYSEEGPHKNILEIKKLINSVKINGGSWIYFDDLLTLQVTDVHPEAPITKETIDEVCNYAHSQSLLVAASESYYQTFDTYNGHINYLEKYWSLYENIDFIMPYGYTNTIPELTNFYNYLLNKGKKIVPILGYNVDFGGNNRSFQLGAYSGDTGFIENAMQYAYNSMVFYYFEGNITEAYLLTNNLQTNNYITGTSIPNNLLSK